MLSLWNLVGGYLSLALPPTNLAAAAVVSAYADMSKMEVLNILIACAVGADGEDPTFALKQATDSSGTGVKALEARRAWIRKATDIKGVVTALTELATDTSKVSDFTATDLGEKQILLLIEVRAGDLDLVNGFSHVAVSIADTGSTAKWCSILFAGQTHYGKKNV